MAKKTPRFRRRRSAACPAAPSAPPPSSAAACAPQVTSRETAEALLVNANLWLKLMGTLKSALSVRSDDAFVDVERLCPRQAFTVVHLDKRLASDPPDDLGPQQETITRILTAVADMSEWAERLRQWDDLSLRFWSMVLSSPMIQAPPDSAWISKWVCFEKAHGVRLLLRWNGTSRRVETLQSPLDTFLAGYRGMPLALELQSCSLSVENIRWVHSLLKKRKSEVASRCSVRALYLNDNTLHADELNALAELLEDRTTPPIEELQLNNTMPTVASDLASTNYVAAFRRVVVAFFTAKGPSDTSEVSLSLESHNNLQFEHIDALSSALQSSTRPLKALSLANVRVVGNRATKQLGRVLFSPTLMANGGCDLNISSMECYDPFHQDSTAVAVRVALSELVDDALQKAHRDDALVKCQCLAGEVFGDEAMTELMAPNTVKLQQYYAVHDASSSDKICIVLREAEKLVGWIRTRSIASVRDADDHPLVGWGFSGLIADGTGDSSRLCMRLIEAAGNRLQRLAMRGDVLLNWNPRTVALLEGCVKISQLNVAKSGVYEDFKTPFWDLLSCRFVSSLRVLDLSDCYVHADSMASLAKFSGLRCLSIRGRRTDWFSKAEDLLPVFRSRCRLQYVEMDYPPDNDMSRRTNLDVLLRRVAIPHGTKMAFLSVLAREEAQHSSRKRLSEEEVVSILRYAGVVSFCTVNWCQPRWLKRPVGFA